MLSRAIRGQRLIERHFELTLSSALYGSLGRCLGSSDAPLFAASELTLSDHVQKWRKTVRGWVMNCFFGSAAAEIRGTRLPAAAFLLLFSLSLTACSSSGSSQLSST